MPENQRTSRIAGVLYLLIIVLGLFSELGVRSTVRIPGDPAGTAQAILASETLFRISVAADVLVFLADVVVAVLLYELLRHAGRTLSLSAAGLRLTGTAIYGTNLLNQVGALLVLTGAGGLAATMGEPGAQGVAALLMELHGFGYDLGLIFFGLHCALLGALLVRSARAPGWLAALMVAAGAGYLIGSFTRLLAPAYHGAVQWVYIFPLVGEVALALWLLVRGLPDTTADVPQVQ